MKKQKFNKKLSLNKETISNLDKIKGGAPQLKTPNCAIFSTVPGCPTVTQTLCGLICP